MGNTGTGGRFIGSCGRLPGLFSADQEQEAVSMLGSEAGEEARSALVEHNLRLVFYIAGKFNRSGKELDELVSIGTIGLIKAVRSYTPEKDVRLSTYAVRCIENEILMDIRKNGKIREELSLDEPVRAEGGSEEPMQSDLPGADEDTVYLEVEAVETRGELLRAVGKLTKMEQEVVRLRYGFPYSCGRERSQTEAAALLGISQSYFSRIERRLLKRLRREIRRAWPD